MRPTRQGVLTTGLTAAELRWRCPAEWLAFESTAYVSPAASILGQDAAAESLRFGLLTNAPGHHVYVRGLAGTGRVTLVREVMERIKPQCPPSRDYCYVRNFERPERPVLIPLPRSQAAAFAARMDEFADFLRDGLQRALSSDPLKAERAALDDWVNKRVEAALKPFEAELREAGLMLVTVDLGNARATRIAPIVDGQPVPVEALDTLVAAGKITEQRAGELRQHLDAAAKKLDGIESAVDDIKSDHERRAQTMLARQIRSVIEPMLDRIRREFPQQEVAEFLDAAAKEIATRRVHAIFKGEDISRLVRANPIVHHPLGESCPIVLESNPSVTNLFGDIEREWSRSGASRTDHMMVTAGSLLRADGGFLLVEARELLAEPGAWRTLIRALRTGRVDFPTRENGMMFAGRGLHPQSIPLNTKVVLVGDAETYALLDQYDPDFPSLFKVLADFDNSVPRTRESVELYARVLARIAKDEQLPPISCEAVGVLIEHGARMAAEAGRLTARFSRVGDVAREAAFIANEKGDRVITAHHVHEAVRRRKRRGDLPARRFREMLVDGTIQVQLRGCEVGQANGLAVVSAGPLVYGFPQRITASVSAGSAGMINIDREAQLSGAIHTKGFYILGGLLRAMLQPDHPFAFDASIAFEQSYGWIDGDSASAAEACCLLSAITGYPLRQDFAITGAIDQKGHVMAIGAVNEKIEGFYDACKDVGFTGTQGVLIPASNVGDLVLRLDVVEACEKGTFRVVPLRTIGDAIEALFVVPDLGEGASVFDAVIARAKDRIAAFWKSASRAKTAQPT